MGNGQMDKLKGFLASFKTLADIARLRNVLIAFFGVLTGALLFSMDSPLPPFEVLGAAISAALILAGGNALNDYFDFEIDKLNKPKRPIPSGRITRPDAFILAMTFFLIGLGLAKSINRFCLGIAIINTIVLIVYGRWGKKMLVVSNLVVAYLVGSVFIYGAAAVFNPAIHYSPVGLKLMLVMTACAFLITLAREIVKDIEDMHGDRKAYSDTLPLRFGANNAKFIALSVALVTTVLSFVPIIWMPPLFNELLYGILIIVTDIVILGSFSLPPQMNQRVLVFSMILALLAFLAGISPTYWGALGVG